MTGITPTVGIIETGNNVRLYTKQHKEAFWNILNPLLPWILGLVFVDLIVNIAVPFFNGKFGLGGLLISYFYTCFVISWHRVMIEGPDNATPMNPFKPERSDWAFIGMGLGIGLAAFLVIFLSGLTMAISPVIGGLLTLIVVLALIICFPKVSLYFPAKAVRQHMSLADSFAATNGYVLKIITAPLVASWRIFLVVFAYVILMGLAMAVIMPLMLPADPENMEQINPMLMIVMCIFELPFVIYFQPILYALGVGILSNYYLYITQNKSA